MSNQLSISLIHYPGSPMARFGLVDPAFGGGNLYRLIWAPSRWIVNTLAEGTITRMMYVDTTLRVNGFERTYPAIVPAGEAWVLEKWQSPEEFGGSGITAEKWNADRLLLNLGPFPHHGEYEYCETLSCNPSQANLDKLIMWIEAGRGRERDNNAFIRNQVVAGVKDRKAKVGASARNSMRPFGAEAMEGYGQGRKTKSAPTLRPREELNLPGPGSSSRSSRFGVPVIVSDEGVRQRT